MIRHWLRQQTDDTSFGRKSTRATLLTCLLSLKLNFLNLRYA